MSIDPADPAMKLLGNFVEKRVLESAQSLAEHLFATFEERLLPLEKKVDALEKDLEVLKVEQQQPEKHDHESNESFSDSEDDEDDADDVDDVQTLSDLEGNIDAEVQVNKWGHTFASKGPQSQRQKVKASAATAKPSKPAKGQSSSRGSLRGKASNRGRPLGRGNDTTPKETLRQENIKLKKQLKALRGKKM